jgi:hypothetical protein
MKPKTIEYFGHTLEVPKWARFVAMEEDGDVLVFEEQPHLADSWWFTTDGDEMSRVATISAENINYKNSVVELEIEKPDAFTIHEALHSTNMVCEIAETHLRNHWLYESGLSREFNVLIDQAIENLAAAYQAVGKLSD